MSAWRSALWGEFTKARRSPALPLTALGFLILPAVGALFMYILANPERARSMGLISAKAQLGAAAADWPAYVGLIEQGTAIGGAILFAIVTTWIFGREFSDRTVTDLLALPTGRAQIVAAKFAVNAVWVAALVVLIAAVALVVGALLGLPGWLPGMGMRFFADELIIGALVFMALPTVAFATSAGRGYLAGLGFTILTIVLAQVAAVLGWGGWVPWAVPALYSGAAGERAALLGLHSLLLTGLLFAAGAAATLLWWLRADQAD